MQGHEIIGRDNDLSRLKHAWMDVQEGIPCFFVVKADSGVGKTRLIQEFYHWLSKEHDDDNYWCDSLYDERKAMSIVPPISDLPLNEVPDLPWLWLASRCQGVPVSSGEGEVDVAFDAVRHQLAIHLSAIFRAQKRKHVNKNLAKAGFGLIASFALPGSGHLIEIFNVLMEGASGTLSVTELYSALKRKIKDNKSDATSLEDVAKKEQGTIIDSAIKAFSALLDSKDKTSEQDGKPIILFFDDAQYLDPVTGEIIERLIKEAEKNNWPLLILVACWEESLRFKQSKVFNSSLDGLIEKSRKLKDKKNIKYIEHELSPLPINDLSKIAQYKLPNLSNEAVEIISNKANGDIDLLLDFIDEMKQSPEWLNPDGSIAVDPGDLEKLPSKAAEMARRRLNSVGENIRETLTWASAQGYQFDEFVLKRLLDRLKREIDAHNTLREADESYGFVQVKENPVLSLEGEFRRLAYYEACKQFFDSHPKGKKYLSELAYVIKEILNSKVWNDFQYVDKSRIGRLFVTLIDDLHLSGDTWKVPLNDLLLDLAQIRMLLGDTYSAERYSERILRTRSASSEIKTEARKILVTSAYMEGDLQKEEKRLMSWRKSNQGNTQEYFYSEALFSMRQGKTNRSIDMSKKGMALAGSTKDKVEGGISLAVAMWANGNPEGALIPLKQAEDTIAGELEEDSDLIASLRHSCCLVLHDLEKNAQVMYHAKSSIEHYERMGNLQEAIISRVNYGDAMWGVGLTEQAVTELKKAYRDAADLNLLHAKDIAAICLANVLREEGRIEEAKEYYLEGISLAKEIGHLWDQIYGEIYYESLHKNTDPQDSLNQLDELSKQALEHGYGYLYDLSLAVSAVIRQELGQKPDVEINEVKSTYKTPLASCYLEAEKVLYLSNLDRKTAKNFIMALGECEGIKGVRNFILKAVDKVLHVHDLTGVEKEFIKRWQGRFVWEDGVLPDDIKIAPCDYKTCEARCCYDGVYLVEGEEEIIRNVVDENRGYFRHLPTEYIISDSWGSVSGLKTATVKYNYSSPDFPDHFTKTRCVFALEDGACSLQALANKKGKPSWEYKPISCVMHPLSVRGESVLAPPTLGQKDESFVGVSYPGYSSFTPCGQLRSDGSNWKEVFAEEIAHWKKRFNND
ncbi:MAG: AAA family ATPase [Candidatus Thiodiazotropha taylori]|nr:AAA family ATPase [Candidatus Thiodiazotropha taylori]